MALLAVEHHDGGSHAGIVRDRDPNAADTEAGGMVRGHTPECHLWAAPRVGAYLDIVPPDVRLTAKRLRCRFFGGKATGQSHRPLWAARQIRLFILGQNALPEAIAVSLQCPANARH